MQQIIFIFLQEVFLSTINDFVKNIISLKNVLKPSF